MAPGARAVPAHGGTCPRDRAGKRALTSSRPARQRKPASRRARGRASDLLAVWEFDRVSDLGGATRAVLDGSVEPAFQAALLSSQGDAITLQLVGLAGPSGDPDAVFYVSGFPQVCAELKTVIAIAGFASRFRQWTGVRSAQEEEPARPARGGRGTAAATVASAMKAMSFSRPPRSERARTSRTKTFFWRSGRRAAKRHISRPAAGARR